MRGTRMTWWSWCTRAVAGTGCCERCTGDSGRSLANSGWRWNEEKSRVVDLRKGESFGFLGFDFRRVRSRWGRWRPLLYAAAHEAHGVAANAPGYFLSAPVSAGQWGGAAHQPHPARLGHLLCGGPIQSVFLVYLLLGRSRAAAALAAEPETSGLRVVSMALAAGLADGRGLSRLSRAPVSASSRFYSVGPITL